jgi:hypothetical protein
MASKRARPSPAVHPEGTLNAARYSLGREVAPAPAIKKRSRGANQPRCPPNGRRYAVGTQAEHPDRPRSLALNEGLGLGVAYGIWAAAGVALTAVASKILFKEPLIPVMMGGIALIIGGVLLVELGAAH